jgi:ABC-type phosphate transport system substrate-binding protein
VTRKRLAATLAALGVATVAVAAMAGTSSAKSTASLTGAGSTFVVPLVTTWTQHYHGATVNYSASRRSRPARSTSAQAMPR